MNDDERYARIRRTLEVYRRSGELLEQLVRLRTETHEAWVACAVGDVDVLDEPTRRLAELVDATRANDASARPSTTYVWRLADGRVPLDDDEPRVGDELELDVVVTEVAPLERDSVEVVVRVTGVS